MFSSVQPPLLKTKRLTGPDLISCGGRAVLVTGDSEWVAVGVFFFFGNTEPRFFAVRYILAVFIFLF